MTVPIVHTSDVPQCLMIAGPYRTGVHNSQVTIYEVALVTNGRYGATLANCRHFSTAVARAKRERTVRQLGDIPIYTRFPGDDPVLLKE